MPPASIVALFAVAATSRFRLTLWDLVFDSPEGPGREFTTAFDTGVTARACFARYSGTPEGELEHSGTEAEGSLRCRLSGIEAARYRFEPIHSD